MHEITEYEKWAEIYYQVSMLIFGEQQSKSSSNSTNWGEQFYTKSLGAFVRSSRIIQLPCKQGFPELDNARQRRIA